VFIDYARLDSGRAIVENYDAFSHQTLYATGDCTTESNEKRGNPQVCMKLELG
jgi:hypothetical protein